MKGALCPNCKKSTMQLKDGDYRECHRCGIIGWGPSDPVRPGKSGKGWKCPICSRSTLQKILERSNFIVCRCSNCSYSTVETARTRP